MGGGAFVGRGDKGFGRNVVLEGEVEARKTVELDLGWLADGGVLLAEVGNVLKPSAILLKLDVVRWKVNDSGLWGCGAFLIRIYRRRSAGCGEKSASWWREELGQRRV